MTSEQRKLESISNQEARIDTATITDLPAHDQADSSALLEPYRRELHLHCYRILGSLHDAEDMVQETMIRAWRRFDTFKGTSSLRTWLYTIATNACLDALKKRTLRTLPTASSSAMDEHSPIPPPTTEATWLEPFPDTWMAESAENPEARYTRQESVSLAFLTALQLLPPRQRAVLLLSDVLDWQASEIAHLLETSVSATNSALHRARVTLEKNYHADEQKLAEVSLADAKTSALLNRYVHLWETDDITGIVALLKEDAIFSMPPYPSWYRGPAAIRTILSATVFASGIPNRWRFYPTRANTQPAFALYRFDELKCIYVPFGLQIVTLDSSARQVAEVITFHTSSLITAFGCPAQLESR